MNIVILSGNLVRDPEIKYSQSGVAVCTFTVAQEEFRKGGESYVHYIECVAFGKQAEAISNNLQKGSKVFVQGSIDQRRWENNEGKNRNKLQVKAFSVEFGARSHPRAGNDQQQPAGDNSGPLPESQLDSDDIPF